MTKKNIFIIVFVILFGCLSLYLNRDAFAPQVIQISHRSVSPRPWMTFRKGAKPSVNPVVFLINKDLRLNSVKVVLVSDAETNKYPHAIWDMISDSNSIPTREFIYGSPIKGLKLAIKGVGADPLQPGVNYRILVEADSTKLEHDFIPVAPTR